MKLTKSKLAELIKNQCDLQFPIDKIKKLMFKSFVKEDAYFQITYKGFQLLKFAKFKYYKIRLNKPITMKSILMSKQRSINPDHIVKNNRPSFQERVRHTIRSLTNHPREITPKPFVKIALNNP